MKRYTNKRLYEIGREAKAWLIILLSINVLVSLLTFIGILEIWWSTP